MVRKGGKKRKASEAQQDASDGGSRPQKRQETEDELDVDPTVIDQNSNEVRFGRNLVHVDKRVRDNTVAALRLWLKRRSRLWLKRRSSSGVLSDLDLAKIWKGLWYCMWMCDKAEVQQELAVTLSKMTHLFVDDLNDGLRFQATFYIMMRRQWGRLDYYRVDKFYSLIRCFFREGLRYCLRSDPAADADDDDDEAPSIYFDMQLVQAFMGIIRDECLLHLPNGYRMHMVDIFLPELKEAVGPQLTTEVLMAMLEPWLALLAAGGIPGQGAETLAFHRRVHQRIFDDLLTYVTPKAGKAQEGEESPEAAEAAFGAVEPVAIQKALFDIASGETTRERLRSQLYKLVKSQVYRLVKSGPSALAIHAAAVAAGAFDNETSRKERRAAKAAERAAAAAESDDGEGSDDGDGEGVQGAPEETPERAGKGPKGKKHKGVPVAGWAAAGIESGEINEGGGNGNAAVRKPKKRKAPLQPSDASDVTEATTTAAPAKKAVAPSTPAADTPGASKSSKKKRKKQQTAASTEKGLSENGAAANAPSTAEFFGAETSPSVPADTIALKFASASGKKHKPKAAPSPAAMAAAAAPAAAAASPAVTPAKSAGGSGKTKKEASSDKKKQKKENKSPGEGGTPSPSTPAARGPLQGGKAGASSTGAARKKKVTFGGKEAKDYRKSIKDLQTKPATPAKQTAQPSKGLLKTPVKQGATPAKQGFGTPTPGTGLGMRGSKTAPRPAGRKRAKDF
ncbi:nucleolar protein,Nop52-domain-containing protein, partial [Tribonema minus]